MNELKAVILLPDRGATNLSPACLQGINKFTDSTLTKFLNRLREAVKRSQTLNVLFGNKRKIMSGIPAPTLRD